MSNQESEKRSLERYLQPLQILYLEVFRPWSLVAVPNLQCLRSLCRDLVSHGPNKTAQIKRTMLAPCYYNFNSDGVGKPRVATTADETTTT